jgi:hypothetical protein
MAAAAAVEVVVVASHRDWTAKTVEAIQTLVDKVVKGMDAELMSKDTMSKDMIYGTSYIYITVNCKRIFSCTFLFF